MITRSRDGLAAKGLYVLAWDTVSWEGSSYFIVTTKMTLIYLW